MSYYEKYLEPEVLRGKRIKSIVKPSEDRIEIETEDGKRYAMIHVQDCCESVRVHDVVGDLDGLIGKPTTVATKETSDVWPEDVARPEYCESFTWTTYRLETETSKVRIRWLGVSNGYYGEGVDLVEV